MRPAVHSERDGTPGPAARGEFWPYLAAICAGAGLEFVAFLTGKVDGASLVDATIMLGPVVALFGIRNPAFFFPFYIFIGQLKLLPGLREFPGNLSVLVGIFMAFVCVVDLVRRKKVVIHWPALILFGVLAMLLVLAYFRSVMPLVAQIKMIYLTTFIWVSFVAPMFLLTDRHRVMSFLKGLIVVGAIEVVALFLLAAVDPATYKSLRMGVAGGAPIATANTLVVGILVALYWWLARSLGNRMRVFIIAFVLLSAAGVLASGSRGPFLFGLATVLSGLLFYLWKRDYGRYSTWLRIVFVAGCLTLAAVGFRTAWFSEEYGGSERTVSIISGGTGALESNPRIPLMKIALGMMAEKPLLGYGLGGFLSKLHRPDTWNYSYPHNLILDVGCEAGIPAALLLSSLIILALWQTAMIGMARQGSPDVRRLGQTVFLILLFIVLEHMVSGEAFRNRSVWGFLGVAFSLVSMFERKRRAD